MASKITPKHVPYLVVLISSVGLFLGCGNGSKIFSKNIGNAPFDAVIVPGCPYEDSTWSSLMKIRVHWAAYLHQNGYAKNIIFSGAAVYSPYIESEIMGMYAQELGIDKKFIFYEKRAEHSVENVYYSKLIADSLGFKNVALATDPFQSKMVKRFIKKRKLNVIHLPIHFDSLHTNELTTPQIADEKAFVVNFKPLTEKESWFERWRGTRGKHIKWKDE